MFPCFSGSIFINFSGCFFNGTVFVCPKENNTLGHFFSVVCGVMCEAAQLFLIVLCKFFTFFFQFSQG